ncbi:MAG: metal-dependent transcriptional regulator [Phascolarctobacterium sp.]|nr:metal-dependent transcriptional regulator [Phascolarctobacterium sp.]
MSLLESGENYLETILILTNRKGAIRSIDVAAEMNFSKASVSRAMSILKRNNYIIMETDGNILLTKEGLKKASAVLDRHVTLARFIEEVLGVPPEIAEKDACRIEHIISPETYAGIKLKLIETKK